jgi:hypothetical protein
MRTRRADKGGICPLCCRRIFPNDPIRNTAVRTAWTVERRWAHAECVPDPVPYVPYNPPRRLPEPVAERTPADVQRGALACARAELNRMRAAGWVGDEAAQLVALRRQYEAEL